MAFIPLLPLLPLLPLQEDDQKAKRTAAEYSSTSTTSVKTEMQPTTFLPLLPLPDPDQKEPRHDTGELTTTIRFDQQQKSTAVDYTTIKPTTVKSKIPPTCRRCRSRFNKSEMFPSIDTILASSHPRRYSGFPGSAAAEYTASSPSSVTTGMPTFSRHIYSFKTGKPEYLAPPRFEDSDSDESTEDIPDDSSTRVTTKEAEKPRVDSVLELPRPTREGWVH